MATKKNKQNITLSQAIEAHLRWCASAGYSTNTTNGYKVANRLFMQHVGDKVMREITAGDVEAFQVWAINTPVAPSGVAPRPARKRRPKTVANYHIALSSLWTWAKANEWVDTHVVQATKAPKVHEPLIDPLTAEQVSKLVKSVRETKTYKNNPLATNTRPTAARDKMIFCLLMETGLRASEVCALRLQDVEFRHPGGRVRVIEGKGKKDRFIPFGRRAADAVNAYLLTRPKALPTDFLLVNEGRNIGQPMNKDTLGRLVKRAGQRVGIAVHTHRLRVTAACLMAKNGMSVYELQRILGHSSITTTYRYIKAAHLDLEGAMNSASPLDNLRL